jgi:hypothetical protein
MEYPTALKNIFRFLTLLLAASSLPACSSAQNSNYSVESMQSELNKALPKGTDSAAVEKYLTDKGFEHSGIIDNADSAHMGADPETLELKSIIRETKKSAMATTDIAMTFTFDRDKKLTDIAVKEVHTGL